MKRGLVGLLGAVLLWAPGCACGGGGAEPPRRLVARQELTNASPTAALGEDCTAGGRNACRTGVCLHHGGFDRGYTCSRLCTTDADCPADGWACGEILPGDSNRFCIPPRAWTARAVSVRPASAASPVRAAAPATATTSLDGGLSP